MRVAITGHTKGIGQSLEDYFTSKGHVVYGFSRSNGYDIDDDKIIEKIIYEISDFDVLINNAYFLDSQKKLLLAAIKHWDGLDKIIVNISSKSTLMSDKLVNSDIVSQYFKDYILDKREQNKIIMDRIFKGKPHILNILSGIVDTDMGKEFDCRKMSTDDIAKFIYTLIEFRDTIAVQNVILDVPGLDWADIRKV